MCGIYAVAASDHQSASERVLQGLQRLEYRGYDSWGVVATHQDGLVTEKHVGKIGQVAKLTIPDSRFALGHTRWATHGGVTKTNAHPHHSHDGSFALVQNGVVENYQTLKTELEKQGYEFRTQTDTEVIVHLVSQTWQQSSESALSLPLVARAVSQLAGRSTVGILTTEGTLLAFRYGSPLVIARNQAGELFLSSDVLSVAAEAEEFYPVKNGELVEIKAGQARVCHLTAPDKPLTIPWQPIDLQAAQLDKDGFEHFMLKEIQEQSRVLHQVINQNVGRLTEFALHLTQAHRIYSVGAGSASYAAGQMAEEFRQAGLPATELKAYQAQSYIGLVKPGDICLAISQSGETADTLETVEALQARGAEIASLVNMSGSSLTALSVWPFMLGVGPEVGVASTKALTGQLAWGKVMAALVNGKSLADCQGQLQQLEGQLEAWLADQKIQTQLKNLAEDIAEVSTLFVLGRGQLYYPSLEFALKLKEVCYLHAEGFSAGELKHGTIALIEKGTPVICLVVDDEETANMISAATEVKARGALVIGVSSSHHPIFDVWIPIPSHDWFSSVLSIIPAQLLAYHLAVVKGLDPDKPRNLAKSVTVK